MVHVDACVCDLCLCMFLQVILKGKMLSSKLTEDEEDRQEGGEVRHTPQPPL